MERFVLTTEYPFTEAELERLRATFTRWQRNGGLIVLNQGMTLTPFPPPRPPTIHDGVSDESLSWADEERS